MKLFTQAILAILVLQILCPLTLNLQGMFLLFESHVCSSFSCCRYRVFLGHKQYFVSTDVGAGKMQWYGFRKEPPGGVDSPRGIYSSDMLSLLDMCVRVFILKFRFFQNSFYNYQILTYNFMNLFRFFSNIFYFKIFYIICIVMKVEQSKF